MEKFKILSIDGGGLRGVVPLTILKKVEELTGKRVHEYFDFIAGTSTGGLIASAVSIKNPVNDKVPLYSLDDIIDVYVNRGHEIFPERNAINNAIHKIKDLLEPKFDASGIESVFKDVLKNYRLNDCFNHLMVCSYDLANNLPLFFKSRSARNNPAAQNALLYDICRATSAGPTYLPSYEFYYPNNDENPKRNCIDGGVFINNPSLSALTEFSKYHKYYLPSTIGDDDIDYKNVFVLSIGTGSYAAKINDSDTLHKGEVFWATRISEIMMRGVNEATDYEMTEMMETGNYLRLNIEIDDETHADMSNSSAETTRYLINATKNMLVQKESGLKDFIDKIE